MPSADAARARASRAARDLYDVLGVDRAADDGTIKHAYRRLARALHPDVSAEPDAEDRFRELTAAYGVLSDPQARMLYDRFGYRGRGRGFDSGERRPSTPFAGVDVDEVEAVRGTSRAVRYSATEPCEACGGDGFERERTTCASCRGQGKRGRTSIRGTGHWLEVEECAECRGRGFLASACPACEGSGTHARDEVLRVRIPAGVEDGTRLRVAGTPEHEHLVVQVRPLPADSILVRLAAVALLAGAIALLAYFLTLR